MIENKCSAFLTSTFIFMYMLRYILQLTFHSVEANNTEHFDLFCTANSHTFHNLIPNTAYSLTITLHKG